MLTDEMSTPSSNPVLTALVQHEIRERLNPTLGMFRNLQRSSQTEAVRVSDHSEPGGTAPLVLQKRQRKLMIPQPPQTRDAPLPHPTQHSRTKRGRGRIGKHLGFFPSAEVTMLAAEMSSNGASILQGAPLDEQGPSQNLVAADAMFHGKGWSQLPK